MSEVTEKLKPSIKTFDDVLIKLETLRKIFLHPKDLENITYQQKGFVYSGDITISTVYQDKNITVTIGTFCKKDAVYPYHVHSDSIEYLIVSQGKFVIKFDDGVVFKTRGECMSVPNGVRHSCMSLEDNSIMVAICIPPERAYEI